MYHNLKELLQQSKEKGVLLSQIVLENEIEQFGYTKEQVYTKLEERYEVMHRAATKALHESLPTAGNLITGIAMQQNTYTEEGQTLCGNFMNTAMAMALSGSEVNASMGRICAAPTAGACGIVPAVLFSIEKAKNLLLRGESVAHTAELMGYANLFHFIRQFKQIAGVTPGQFRG